MGKKPVGQVPSGWQRQGLQVPDSVAEKFKAQAARAGVGGIKALGTAAIAIITEMPDDLRYALMRKAGNDTWPDPADFKPRDMWRMLVALILAEAGEMTDQQASERAGWYIDKILDPELTPEPGKKASDRAAREDRA
jgi:hypothetical protein